MGTFVAVDGDTIRFHGRKLGWWEAWRAHKALRSLSSHDTIREIVLDLSQIVDVYPNGIVPIISYVEKLRSRQDVQFRVIPPSDPATASFASRLSWLHQLAPEVYPAGSDGVRSLAVQRYQSADELNPAINDILTVCLQQLAFAEGVSDAFGWTINEIAGNVLDYAEAPGWIQVVSSAAKLVFVVCDAGIGVPATIKRFFPEIHDDKSALELAIKAGVKKSPTGQGNGVAGSLAIAQESNGTFQLTSGEASVNYNPTQGLKVSDLYHPYEGTFVEMQLDTHAAINVQKALWGHKPLSNTELLFGNEEGDLVLRLRDYAANFGNRPTGARMRNLIKNVLVENPGRRVRVLLEDVTLVSSSFADELFGKLVAEMGIIDFASLIALQGLNPLCKSIIDSVIQQRLAQNYIEARGKVH